MRTILFFILTLPAVSLLGQEPIDFNDKIRPILSNKCFACHGPDENSREAGVRLDTFEGATDWVIDVDYPEDSELLIRIASDDEDLVMPPPKHGKPLTQQEQGWIKQWIKEGAKYDKHWAYVNPKKTSVPDSDSQSKLNPIDRFVQAKLAELKLQPSAPADRRTIIRRLALDLTGLPPTLEEVEKFLADQSEDAYEKLVDYYLAKPAYGERWASVWLDLARYADSAGFAEDKKRTIWAYRDYVIRSYNQNKRFDQFTLEQIAGDLLDEPTDESRIATAFHRNTLTNSEGGTSDEEFRSAAVVDRVNTTMAVWMGTTMACAQCHTHKYDPITQTEYFQFYDFLNQTEDNDHPDERPKFSIYSQSSLARKSQLLDSIAKIKQTRDNQPTDQEIKNWEDTARRRSGAETTGRYIRISLPGNKRILSLAEVQVFAHGKKDNVATQGKATQSSTAFSGPPKYANDGNTSGVFEEKTVTHTAIESDPWWQLELDNNYSIDRVVIWNRNGLEQRLDGFQLSILDENQKVVWTRDFSKAIPNDQTVTVQGIPLEIQEILRQDSPQTDDQVLKIKAYYSQLRQAKLEAQIRKLQSTINQIPATTSVPVMRELAAEKKRTTQVQIRGNYLDTGETVSATTPAVFHALLENAPRNRKTLAKWLVDSKNPLAARVVVNRYWEQIFGIGIVETSEEFGAQGEAPSHPQLLDWLACDLMENGWDTKRLVKQLVMSATYRQSSKTSQVDLEADPKNRWLARGPRVRLSAEMIRDQALAVSGLLSTKMYGPPVQPPQPKVGLKPAFTGATTDWTDSTGPDRYRRGIYTEWRRSSPYPSMATFDVNSREVCEIRRTATNTPLQALVTLNDPVYVEAAQALARRITSRQGLDSDREIAKFAFQLCLIRNPSAKELDRILALFESTKQHFSDNPSSAVELATDPLNPPAQGTNFVELAAWTTVANVLLNLDEMLMKP